jgi:hypothetical protein
MYVLPRAGSPTMQITCGAAIALRRRVDSLRIGDPSAGALPQQILHQLRQLQPIGWQLRAYSTVGSCAELEFRIR